MLLMQGVRFNSSILNQVQILTVDNDRGSGELYTASLENYGGVIVRTESIKEALSLLNRFVPDILICEVRFLGESVYPLIRQVRYVAQNRHKIIPIFAISTFPVMNLAEHLKVRVEAYQIKPIDLDQFVDEVWNLVLLSKTPQPLSIQNGLTRLGLGKTSYCSVGVE